MSWVIREQEQAAAALGEDLDGAEILYVITVSDLIDRYDQRHDPADGGDGSTWEGLDATAQEELKRQAGKELEVFNSMSAYYWADAVDAGIAVVEGGS